MNNSFKSGKKGFSLMEIIVAMAIIAVALLLSIRVYPYIFTLNRQIEDVNVAKNLTEQLFQTMRAEINTSVLNAANDDLTYYGQTTLKAHNLINSRKCFWQLVTLTDLYGPPVLGLPPGLDTYLDPNPTTAATKFNNINPSKFEPAVSNDWVATRQFWIDWRNNVEKQLPPYNQNSSERASAIVTARYVTFDSDNNLIIAENGNYALLANNIICGGTERPNLNTKDYMLELTVSIYWKPRKFEGAFNRNNAKPKPNYLLSTMLTAPPEAILKDPTPTPP